MYYPTISSEFGQAAQTAPFKIANNVAGDITPKEFNKMVNEFKKIENQFKYSEQQPKNKQELLENAFHVIANIGYYAEDTKEATDAIQKVTIQALRLKKNIG